MMHRIKQNGSNKVEKFSPRTEDKDPTVVKISARKPQYHNGNFQALEPVNPRRQRIIVGHNTLQPTTVDQVQHQHYQSLYSNGQRNVSLDSEPYPNLVIIGDADKLYQRPAEAANQDISDQRRLSPGKQTPTGSYGVLMMGGRTQFTTTKGVTTDMQSAVSTSMAAANQDAVRLQNMNNQHGSKNLGIFSNNSFIMSNGEVDEQVAKVGVDYKPPPSAPAGNNPRGRIKMYTSLQPRPFMIQTPPVERVESPSINNMKQQQQSMKQGAASDNMYRKAIQRGQTPQSNSNATHSTRNNNYNEFRSVVVVPDQKLGAARTRILLSVDDMKPGSLQPAKYIKDNYLQEEQEESDGMVNLDDAGLDEVLDEGLNEVGVDNADTQIINKEHDQNMMVAASEGIEEDNESEIENNYGEADAIADAEDEEIGYDRTKATPNEDVQKSITLNVDAPFEESKQLSSNIDDF